MNKYSAIIIGAGMSGVKVAGDLYNAGETNTLILESRDRMGGRLKSHKATLNQELCYDFGALWFHDCLKNPLFEKSKKLGNVNYFYDDGKCIYLSEDCKNIPTWHFETITGDIETFASLYFEENPQRRDISVREICEIYLQKNQMELTPEQLKYAQQVVRMWLELWNGLSWEDLSAKHAFFWGADHVGRNAFVKNGYTTIFKNELDELPNSYQDKNIKLSAQVISIDYADDDSVTISTKDGSVFVADYVVVTAPLSVLRISDTNDEQFLKWTPPLPERIRSFLPDLEYGSLGKIVFEFDTCFWPTDVHRFYVLASELGSGGDTRPWQNPTMIINYSAMSNIPSLIFLTQSPFSRQIEEMTTNRIWELFEPVVKHIATGRVKKPFNVLRTEWNNDPFSRGSYSAGRLHTRKEGEICDIMAEGISNRVRFAGAETIGGSANGCAHGAYLSGEREASFILKQMRSHAKM